MIGAVQTGDIDKAIAVAEKHIRAGGHIQVSRHEYVITAEDLEKAEEHKLSDGEYGRPLGHERVEYEVYVDEPKKCPKCGKPFLHLGFFGGPDGEGICGMTVHKYEPVAHLVGTSQFPSEKCFLTLQEYNDAFGEPVSMCVDCVSAGLPSDSGWCAYCLQFNNRPNFVKKGCVDELEDVYYYSVTGGSRDEPDV